MEDSSGEILGWKHNVLNNNKIAAIKPSLQILQLFAFNVGKDETKNRFHLFKFLQL